MNNLFYGSLMCSLLAGMAALPAQAEEAFYVRALAGFGSLSDSSLSSTDLGNGDAGFGVGFNGGGSIGYDFGDWRLESEIMYRTNDLDEVTGTVYDSVDDGDFSSLGFGVTALYEFNLLENPKITSYAGLGALWFQEIDIDFESAGGELSYSGDDWALQILLGARYELQQKVSLYAELRHLTSGDIQLDGEGAALGSVEADYDRTELLIGISYRF